MATLPRIISVDDHVVEPKDLWTQVTTRSFVFASGGRQADASARAALVDNAFFPPLRGRSLAVVSGRRAGRMAGTVALHGQDK